MEVSQHWYFVKFSMEGWFVIDRNHLITKDTISVPLSSVLYQWLLNPGD